MIMMMISTKIMMIRLMEKRWYLESGRENELISILIEFDVDDKHFL